MVLDDQLQEIFLDGFYWSHYVVLDEMQQFYPVSRRTNELLADDSGDSYNDDSGDYDDGVAKCIEKKN